MTFAFLKSDVARTVFKILEREGHETRVIGGAVRNALMSHPIVDLDFCTTLTPDAILLCAAAAGVRAIPTGFDHGTVTLLIGDVAVEVTTLREDVMTDGRHAKVRFGTCFESDAARRDFTMNAISLDENGRVYDYYDGLSDIKSRHVRFIGDPEKRIREDYLRILRFFRFSACYGKDLDSEALSACVTLSEGLRGLSKERVGKEMRLILRAKNPLRIIQVMAETGILSQILGVPLNTAALGAVIVCEEALEISPAFLPRFSALAFHSTESHERLNEAIGLTRQEKSFLRTIARFRMEKDLMTSEFSQKRALYRFGEIAYRESLLDYAAVHQDVPSPAFQQAYGLPARWTAPTFPVSGRDLLAAGVVTAGPDVGALLDRLKARWETDGMPESFDWRSVLKNAELTASESSAAMKRE